MTAMLTLSPIANADRAVDAVYPIAESASQTSCRGLLPLSVPKRQIYYWTARWQTEEEAALCELDAGLGHTFADGASAAAWLLADEA